MIWQMVLAPLENFNEIRSEAISPKGGELQEPVAHGYSFVENFLS